MIDRNTAILRCYFLWPHVSTTLSQRSFCIKGLQYWPKKFQLHIKSTIFESLRPYIPHPYLRLLIFQKFSQPSGAYRTPPPPDCLLIFKKKFPIMMLLLLTCYIFNSFEARTPIWSIFTWYYLSIGLVNDSSAINQIKFSILMRDGDFYMFGLYESTFILEQLCFTERRYFAVTKSYWALSVGCQKASLQKCIDGIWSEFVILGPHFSVFWPEMLKNLFGGN